MLRSFLLQRRLALFCLIVSLCAFLCSCGACLAQNPPSYPENASLDDLIAFQQSLSDWGSQNKLSSDLFWDKTAALFLRSTQEILQQDLDEERVELYQTQLAGILSNYALQEALKNSSLDGEKYRELLQNAGKAASNYRADPSELNQKVYLAYAKQLMSLRLQFALNQRAEAQEELFVSLIGDSITLALGLPAFGEDAFRIVMTIRGNEPELGDEALDALCEAFEASGEPALVALVSKTAGVRRFARLPGAELYFEALIPDEKGEYTKKIELKDYRDKVVLVEVWATWCLPCRKEIPRLKQAYERYHDAGFEILGYSIDQDVSKLQPFLTENQIPWPVASQRRSAESGYHPLYEYYSINGVPEMILIGRDGKVIQTDCRGSKLAKALKELFPNVEPLDWDPSQDFGARATSQDAQTQDENK